MRILNKILFFIVTVSLTACCSWMIKDCEVDEIIVQAKLEIAKNRESTTIWVSRIKGDFEGKESDATYKQARSLYDDAMAENNAWLLVLTSAIADGENLEKSASFKSKSKTAAESSNKFVQYCSTIPTIAEEKSMSFVPIAAEIIKMLVDNGIVIWKAYRLENQKERVERAERTKKEFVWKRWDELE